MFNSRRSFLAGLGGALAGCQSVTKNPSEVEPGMPLAEFEPRSMLVTGSHPVSRAKFPAIDVHAHLIFAGGLRRASEGTEPPTVTPPAQLQEIVGWMDELNLETLVNLTGGWGYELDYSVEALAKQHAGRFLVCTEPAYTEIQRDDYPQWQADEITRAKESGAVGIKVLKTLGLYLRENITQGKLVNIDDPRFDPMWETAGKLGLPIFIHTADPDAFFTPTDRFNERWEELGNHPNWSFYGADFPSKVELLRQRNNVIERHPNTKFVGLHVGNHPEDLSDVAGWLDRYPNFFVETGARLGALGRQPRAARRFFERYQDRILFGTDAVPLPQGEQTPQQVLKPEMFQAYFRFFETEDEYFDYSPAKTPPQGRWKISGIGLPDEILRKVYAGNARRVLGLAEA